MNFRKPRICRCAVATVACLAAVWCPRLPAQENQPRSATQAARVVIGTIARIEKTDRLVTLRDPAGKEFVFTFRFQTQLSDFSVGDSAQVQYRDTGVSPLPATKMWKMRTAAPSLPSPPPAK